MAGRRVVGPSGAIEDEEYVDTGGIDSWVNTRVSLWPGRWPAIAKQVCIDVVESAPVELQEEAKRNLPCIDCELNTQCLNGKRKELGPLLYGREFNTEALSAEASLFPFSLFAPMLNTRLAMVPHFRKPYGIERHLIVVSGWDIAWSEKVGGDYLVRCTSVLDLRTNKRTLLNIQRYPQGLRYSEQLMKIREANQLFQEDLVVLEGDAAQVVWKQGLEEQSDIPVMKHMAGSKQDLRVGVPGLLIDLDSRRWEFPYDPHGLGFDEIRAFLGQCGAFGWHDGKLEGVGEHDDMVMAWWHCSWGLKEATSGLHEFRSSHTREGY
jgi:hypothetical protein